MYGLIPLYKSHFQRLASARLYLYKYHFVAAIFQILSISNYIDLFYWCYVSEIPHILFLPMLSLLFRIYICYLKERLTLDLDKPFLSIRSAVEIINGL